MSNKKTYTIIVTYNGIKWIEKCLRSVVNQSEVIVVDNNSKDNTVQFIRNNFPSIHVVAKSENLGFGKANNLGISIALKKGAEFIFLLNQDAYADSDMVEKLEDISSKKPEYGILSPLHCNWEATHLESAFSNYVNYSNNRDFYSDYVLKKNLKDVYDVPFIAAAAWFITRNCIQKIGGFDPIFFHLGEDANYCQRVLYHKFKIGVVPRTRIFHDTMDRAYKQISKYSTEYFYKLSYLDAVKYADINLEKFDKKVSYHKNQIIKEIVLSVVTLNSKKFSGEMKKYKQFSRQIDMIRASRVKNKLEGAHYLGA